MWPLGNMIPLLLLFDNERFAKIKESLNISNLFQIFLRKTLTLVMFVCLFSCSTSMTYIGHWPGLKGKKSILSQKSMIAFDICARSISYLLCLISEFSSIIKIKTLLALPSMCHITSSFSKNHVQFLGSSASWTCLEFQILLPCCTNWSCALWDDMWIWKYIVSWLFSTTQALEWPIFPTSLLGLLVIPCSSH